MAVRWQISFKTLSDHDGLVKVYDSTYSGDAIELTPTSNPFSTTINRSDMIDPVMADSGYLRVIDNGLASEYIEEMHPQGGMDRPVEFYLDNSLQWRGFISPETLSVEWESAPHEVSFTLIGVLQALEGVEMTDTGVGRQTIAAFLKEILTATGFTWSKIIYAPQLRYLKETDWPSSPVTFGEARLLLSRYNFVRVNQGDNRNDPTWTEMVGDSYLTCLTELCRYFGWVAYQYGDALVLDSPRRDITTMDVMTMAKLDQIIADPTATATVTHSSRGSIAVSGLGFDGIQHRKSINTGYRKVTVKTSDNVSNDVYPSLNFKGKRLVSWECAVTQGSGGFKGRVVWLDTEREHVVLHAYRVQDGQTVEVPWTLPAQDSDLVLPAGAIVKGDTWLISDESNMVNYQYENYIRLSCNKAPDDHFSADVPLIEISSRQVGSFAAGGALCLSANVRSSVAYYSQFDHTMVTFSGENGLTQWGPYANNLRLSLCVGNKWYNGTTWVDTETIFNVPANLVNGTYNWQTFNEAIGQVLNTKTLSMPYNGALGFIIPVNELLEGVMTLKVYPWIKNTPGDTNVDFSTLYISNLNLKYYTDTESENEDGITMSLPGGVKFRQEKTVQANITTSLDNKIGLATLWNGTEPATTFGYLDIASFIRPELWLLRTLRTLYTPPSTELVLEVDIPSFKPYQTLTYNNKNYMVIGQVTDYADEHTKLTIVSYE